MGIARSYLKRGIAQIGIGRLDVGRHTEQLVDTLNSMMLVHMYVVEQARNGVRDVVRGLREFVCTSVSADSASDLLLISVCK
jgi:hypothetical protein